MEPLIGPKRPYQVCTRCVMDTSAHDICFDDQGICNYCTEYLALSEEILSGDLAEQERKLQAFVTAVKRGGKNKPYDCIVGVSGGVDSSWVLVQTVEQGLRPLAVHMDNGWNSELAQNNISNLVRSLGVDLFTHVINWTEYRGLMQAFFDAGVLDIELLYDNAMFAVNYHLAAKYGLKYILSGSNRATEGMRMPVGWNWYKYDKKNIKAIGKHFGGMRLTTFPAFSTAAYLWYRFGHRIKWTSMLDLTAYNKFAAMETLETRFGYKPYPYKHYESVFTRFYQGYILPEKFGVDKRRLHLGTLVMSGQTTRSEALQDLAGSPYPSREALAEDRYYFLKKMGWTDGQLDTYMGKPEVSHGRYPTEYPLAKFLHRMFKPFVGVA